MKLNENTDVIKYKKKVVLANKNNGYWLRLTDELYNYLNTAMALGHTKKQFLDSFENKEDKEYMSEICFKMERLGISEEYKVDYRKEVSIELTNRCNLHCIHCCIDANSFATELKTEEWKKAFDKIVSWKPDSIVLSGGEPLLRKDFLELLTYLRTIYTKNVTLCTNALLIDQNNIDTLIKKVDQIDISIDGVDEQTCSSIRGKGVFGKVLCNIKGLQDKGFKKISLSMAVGDKNEALIEKFYFLNEELGTYPVVRELTFVGRAKRERELLTDLSPNKIVMKKLDSDVNEKLNVNYGNCLYNDNKIFIRCDGAVFACPLVTDSKYQECNIGNVTAISSINRKKMFFLKEILLRKNIKCSDCAVQPFCWGCLAMIKVHTENNDMEDYCSKVKKFYFDIIWGD